MTVYKYVENILYNMKWLTFILLFTMSAFALGESLFRSAARRRLNENTSITFSMGSGYTPRIGFNDEWCFSDCSNNPSFTDNGDDTYTVSVPVDQQYKIGRIDQSGALSIEQVEVTDDACTHAESGDVLRVASDSCNSITKLTFASWDFDKNDKVAASRDGLLLLRYTFGLTGTSLTDDVIAPDSTLVSEKVEANVADAAGSFGDIDGNGNVDALTDGLMLLRYLSEKRGAPLIDGAVATAATRTTAADIETYIASHMP